MKYRMHICALCTTGYDACLFSLSSHSSFHGWREPLPAYCRSASLSTTRIRLSAVRTARHALVHCSSGFPPSLGSSPLDPSPITLPNPGRPDVMPGNRIEWPLILSFEILVSACAPPSSGREVKPRWHIRMGGGWGRLTRLRCPMHARSRGHTRAAGADSRGALRDPC